MRVILKIPFIGFLLLFGVAGWLNYRHLDYHSWNWTVPFMTEKEKEYEEALRRQEIHDRNTARGDSIIEAQKNLNMDSLEPKGSPEVEAALKELEKLLDEEGKK